MQTMLSRVADHLYWMSRYLERAEHTARLLDVSLNTMLEQSPTASGTHWRQLAKALYVSDARTDVPDPAHYNTNLLAFDRNNGNSIVACVTAARDNAQNIRELISTEMWEQINRLYYSVRRTNIDLIWNARPHEFFRGVQEGAYLFQGITDATMSQGQGWQFIRVGRLVERAGAVAALLDAHFADFTDWQTDRRTAVDYLEWVGLLKSCTAFEAYCKVYTADMQPDTIAEFLLLNPHFPHSVCFAALHLEHALDAIADLTETRRAGRLTKLAGRLRAMLEFGQIDEIMDGNLPKTLSQVQTLCGQIHNTLYQTYFTYPIERELTL